MGHIGDWKPDTAGQSPVEDTYSLCISLTGNGLASRIPWLFVIHPTSSLFGIRLRVEPFEETEISKAAANPDAPPKHALLARQYDYVDNDRCWGRIILYTGMSKAEADKAQSIIENQGFRDMVGGIRDCQKWSIECLPALGIWDDIVKTLNGLRGMDIWGIDKGVNASRLLKFHRGPAYKYREEVEG